MNSTSKRGRTTNERNADLPPVLLNLKRKLQDVNEDQISFNPWIQFLVHQQEQQRQMNWKRIDVANKEGLPFLTP